MNLPMQAAAELARRAGVPASVHIDLLSACDLDCVHCYLADRTDRGMTTGQYVGLLDELADMGVFHLLFSGGELFLRRDTMTILRHARKRRFVVKLITHAGRVTEEVADELAAIGIGEVGVSLYSMVAQDHEAVTRRPGSHARTVAGIRRLRERDLIVQLKIPVMQANRDSWHTVLPFARELGCTFSVSHKIHARDDRINAGDAFDPDDVTHLNVSFQDKVDVRLLVLQESIRQGRPDFHLDPARRLDRHPCGAGLTYAYIGPDGSVRPCVTFLQDMGNVRAQSFGEIWFGSAEMQSVREITKRSFSECQDCAFVRECGHCIGIQHQERGDPTKRSELVCGDTHARFAAAAKAGLYSGPTGPPGTVPRRTGPPPCAVAPGAVGGCAVADL